MYYTGGANMEEKFKAFLKKPWIVRDDGVVFNKTFMPYEKRPIREGFFVLCLQYEEKLLCF